MRSVFATTLNIGRLPKVSKVFHLGKKPPYQDRAQFLRLGSLIIDT